MKKNVIFKIIISVFLVGIIVLTFLYSKSQRNPSSNCEGNVQIILIDQSGKEIKNKTIAFQKDDTFYDLLCQNFEVVAEEGMYGMTIYDIDTIHTDFVNSYIAIYVNDQYSNVGVSYIELVDNLVVKFVETIL